MQLAVGLVTLSLLLGALGWLWLCYWLDPNDLKPWLTGQVRAQSGRTLTIEGDLRWVIRPHLAIEAAGVALSEPGSPREFARARRVHAGVAVWPLLDRRVLVDSLTVQGLSAALIRDGDGVWNVANLIPSGPATLREWRIERVELDDVSLSISAGNSAPEVALRQLSLKAGPLAKGEAGRLGLAGAWAVAGASGQARLEADYTLLAPSELLALRKIRLASDVNMAGQTVASNLNVDAANVSAATLTGLFLTARTDASTSADTRTAELQVTAPSVQLAAESLRVPLSALWRIANAKTQASGNLAATLVHPSKDTWQLAALKFNSEVKLAGRALTTSVTGDLLAGPKQTELKARQLKASLDGTAGQIEGSANALLRHAGGTLLAEGELLGQLDGASLAARWQLPLRPVGRPGLAVTLARLELDRWITPARAGSSGQINLEPVLETLRALDLEAAIAIGTLKQGNLTASDVRIKLD